MQIDGESKFQSFKVFLSMKIGKDMDMALSHAWKTPILQGVTS